MLPGLPAAALLSDSARARIAEAVRQNGGGEVFFLGRAEGGRVVEVEDFCRGNAHMVPALRRVARGFDVAIHNHPGGDLTPSDADLHVAADLGDLGVAFFIVDDRAERVNPVVKLLPREPPPAPVDEAAVSRALGPDGPIAARLGLGFEARPEQERMARGVADALARGGVAAIEAGTGTGKSLAYLVPALLRATAAKERVVVSTNTINLQEQLVRKDIPLVLEAWEGILGTGTGSGSGTERPRAVLMKGRANYACLRKVEDLSTLPESLFEGEAERDEVRTLAAWARRSHEGSREELPVPPSPGGWEHIAVDGDTCTRTACRHYAECFYFKARREAAAADLLVVNHSLLLSDLALRRKIGFSSAAVLPPYRHVILDEAHHLEDVASEHLGEKVTSAGLKRALGRLQQTRRVARGLLPAFESVLLRCGHAACSAAARAIGEKIVPARLELDDRVERAFAAVGAFLDAVGAKPGDAETAAGGDLLAGAPERPKEPSVTLRLRPLHRQRPDWARVRDDGRELATALSLCAASIQRDVLRPLDALEPGTEERAAVEPLALELKAVAGRLGGYAGAIAAFLEDEDKPGIVRWIERRASRARGPLITLRSAPLHVAETLAKEVYPNLGGLVLTSATLAVGGAARRRGPDSEVERQRSTSERGSGPSRAASGSPGGLRLPGTERSRFLPRPSDGFDDGDVEAGAEGAGEFGYLAARVGLDRLPEGRLSTLKLASPFDYARQCLLGVPRDLPDPTERRFDEAAAQALLQAADASGGRAFFLFTSYRALDRAWRALEAPLRARGFSPMRQGDASRRRLVERFREEAPAVLFATDSFWEGVDVRGGALKLVAIARLPFRVPSEPLQEARAEAIAARGGDPFHELTVPQAVLKLKQGFGRLVRSRADRGAILILDRRVLTKGYGRLFLESLPPARLVAGRLAEVLGAVEAACRDGAGVRR